MARDLPDWQRAFWLVGTEITLNVIIEASDVILPVSIEAATATVNVNLAGSDIGLNVKLAASDITLNVDVVAQTVGNLAIDIVAQTMGDINVNIATSDITLNVALGSMPFETTAENLLTNPGFEDGDLTGWDAGGTGTVTVQSDEAWKGTYACKLEVPISGVASVSNSEQIPCYPGQRVLVNAALKADANIDMSKLIVHFRSAEGVYLETIFSPDYGNDYDWTPKTYTFVAPDGAAFALPGAYFTADASAGVGYADSFLAARLVQPALDSSLNLNINIVAQEIAALDINIAASAITVNINFTDQSVAVFDAAKWFAHQAQQVFLNGDVTVDEGVWGEAIDYTVPANRVFYLLGVAYTGPAYDVEIYQSQMHLALAAAPAFYLGSKAGHGMVLDVPLRATAGQHVQLFVRYWSTTESGTMCGSFWGYLEVV